MKRKMKKIMSLILTLTVALTMGTCIPAGTAFAGEIEAQGNDVALTVKYNDKVLKAFTLEELEQIAKADNGGTMKKYTYSAYNTYPTYHKSYNVQGPKVTSIINEAISKKPSTVTIGYEEAADIPANKIISFSGYGMTCKFTAGDILNDEGRFYFSAAGKVANSPWQEVESKDGVAVPALISLAQTDENGIPLTNDNVGKLVFGQTSVHEQNFSAYVQLMTSGGEIIIHDTEAGKWPAVSSTKHANNQVSIGEQVTLDLDQIQFDKENGDRYWVYYSINDAGVSDDSSIYNYNNFNHGNASEKFNKPVFESYGQNTITTLVKGYGKEESDKGTITVTVVLGAPKVSACSSGDSGNIISWNKVPHANRYEVYRGETKIRDVTSTGASSYSITDSGLTAGVSYTYHVVACDDGAGKKSERTTVSSTPTAKVVTPPPACGTPTIKSIKAGKKILTIKWKKVSGAKGYVIYRSTNPKDGFRAIKTIKKAKTVKFVNKKLKKKTTYYYKIIAYKTTGGAKAYGYYSPVKGKKTK